MKQKNIITALVGSIAVAAMVVSLAGILSREGSGPYSYQSVRGEEVILYGRGIYKHMSAEVAIQGIAQDYVTLCIGVPLLLFALYLARQGSLRWRFILAGVLGYFFVTYLFYLEMAMYNALFLVYTFLMGVSFFSLSLTLFSFDLDKLATIFSDKTPVKFSGRFLIFSSITIALLWLSVVVPPLLDGSIYPKAVEHYTTLTVQGLDLGLLLPLAFVSGWLLLRRKVMGYLMAPVYLVFLSLLMAALVAKIMMMGMQGYNVIPVIFLMPTFCLLAVFSSVILLKRIA